MHIIIILFVVKLRLNHDNGLYCLFKKLSEINRSRSLSQHFI